MNELTALAKRFPPGQVKQRTQGGRRLDYISIDMTISRLNAVLETGWDFVLTQTTLLPVDGKFLASVTGEIRTLGKIASGVGSDIASDPDKAYKTALAECLKKAAHQLGVGLYLWDEGERAVIESIRALMLAGDKVGALKLQVTQIATDAGVPLDGNAIAEFFGVSKSALADERLLAEILHAYQQSRPYQEDGHLAADQIIPYEGTD